MKLDWTDIALHILAAIISVALIIFITENVIAALTVNTLFWPLRELWQHRTNPLRVLTGAQSRTEWLAPVAVGFIYAECVSYFN